MQWLSDDGWCCDSWHDDDLAWWELVMEGDAALATYDDIAREVGHEYALYLKALEDDA